MRQDIKYREKIKNINTWGLNNALLINYQVTEEIKQEMKKYLEKNGNKNKIIQNIWDATKAVQRGKFIAIQSYIKKQEKYQIDNLIVYLKQMEKEE